ncbi:MAG: hypothetical protein K2K08_00700, partial [Paramuribaculum sp.]|nr:hypothetical protein [Paramuribaculum sp.]
MNKILLNIISAAALFIAPSALALPVYVQPKDVKVEKTESTVYVSTQIPVSDLKRGTTREAWITPIIKNGSDSLELPAVVVAGRSRYYQALRYNIPAKKGITLYHQSSTLTEVPYEAKTPYQKWMNGAQLSLRVQYKGCCGDELEPITIVPITRIELEGNPERFKPTFNWIAPQAEAVKQRELRGQAYIDFPVNKTV